MDHKIWADMFTLGLPVVEKVLRSVVVYIFLVVGLRLAGKRELAQLNPFDLIVLLTLSNTVQNAIIGEDNSVTGGLIGAATLLGINYLVVRFLYRHRKLEEFVEGRPSMLVEGGKINIRRLKEEAIAVAELAEAAHKQGFASLQEVEKAVLEPSGALTFIGKRPQPEEQRHREVLERLEDLTRRVAHLQRL